ncbi:hypothetical protein JTB14_036874 [Gonioctena quinquepunctata]|nr:hypothetical protein JTB14_036874 [Gonioctena quinquepunctata]
MEGPPIYTMAMLSKKEECGASTTTGAKRRVDCCPKTLKRKPLTMKTQRNSRAHAKRTILPKESKLHYSQGSNGDENERNCLYAHKSFF